MASKLDTLVDELNEVERRLALGEPAADLLPIVKELVRYILTVQEECIKLLQTRNLQSQSQPAQPAFRWDFLRSESSVFKAPYGVFMD